jgi:thiosulfate dehydrogenase (quinone) large subunit
MFAKWLRENNIAAGLLTVLRVWLGYNWMTAGWGKLTGPGFDASGFLKNAVANPVKGPDGNMVYGWYVNFLFFLAGTVSHNPTDIFFGFIILAAGYNAGRYGLDRWVVPFLRKTVLKRAEGTPAHKTV